MSEQESAEKKPAGSRGRTPEMAETMPNGTFKYNRKDMSFAEMGKMNRAKGDLFALFRTETGKVRVQYATLSDYADVAVETLRKVRRTGGQRFGDRADVMFIIGGAMLTRLHNYLGENFLIVLDHEMNAIFDAHQFSLWVRENEALFLSPAISAVLDDDTPLDELEAEYERTDGHLAGGNDHNPQETSEAA